MGQLRSSPFAYASGFQALFYKEVKRFWRVSFQTVAAPVLTAILYLLIFGHVLEDHVKVYGAISYTSFLIPGLVMMSLLQNSFANTSSSLIQSKITGNLIFVLLAPLSHLEFFMAYVLAAMARGLVVGLGVFLATCWFTDISFQMPLWILVFGLLSAAVLGALGLIAGIWAEKFDQLAAFQNLFILTCIQSLPSSICKPASRNLSITASNVSGRAFLIIKSAPISPIAPAAHM
ncbi:MAG: ABC transporter permease, partial [Polynucleobacter victoriensis]